MGDQPGQVVSLAVPLEDQAESLFLYIDRGAIGPQECLFVHTDRGGIDDGLAVLGLGKEQHPAAWTRRIHRCADQRIAGGGQNDGVGASALTGCPGHLHHVLP